MELSRKTQLIPVLRQLIQEILLIEKIRSKTFSWTKFKKLSNLNSFIDYAESKLQYLGEGTSRITYILSSGKILKLAKNDFGQRQNLAEIEVFEKTKSGDEWVPKIYSWDGAARWMVSELVRPATSKEIKDFFGFGLGDLVYWPKTYATAEPGSPFFDRNIKPWLAKLSSEQQEKAKSLGNFLTRFKIHDTDLDDHKNWGINTLGRIVLLDTGFTASTGYDV